MLRIYLPNNLKRSFYRVKKLLKTLKYLLFLKTPKTLFKEPEKPFLSTPRNYKANTPRNSFPKAPKNSFYSVR